MTRFAFKPAAQAAVLLALAGTLGSASASYSYSFPVSNGAISNGATVGASFYFAPGGSSSFSAIIRGVNSQGDVDTFDLFDSNGKLILPQQVSDVVSLAFKKEVFTNYYSFLDSGKYTFKLTSGQNGGGNYSVSMDISYPTTPVPEPVSATLALAGAAVALTLRRRSKI